MDNIKISKTGRVYLYLKDKFYKPKRQLGFIRNKTFHTFRKPDNHNFRKFNAIGLNYDLLYKGGHLFNKIIIEYGFEILETTRENFLKKGKFLHFKQNGLDKQLFLSLDLFATHTDNSANPTQNLFTEDK